MPENPLDQLPPIHLPEPISFWPPAIGWWLLAAVLILLGFFIVRVLIQYQVKNRLRKAALAKLDIHWQAYKKNNNAEEYVLAINLLLKQFVMQQYPDKNLQALSGEQWLASLQELSPQSNFNQDNASVLLSVYQKHTMYDESAISQLHPRLVQWFKGLSLAS